MFAHMYTRKERTGNDKTVEMLLQFDAINRRSEVSHSIRNLIFRNVLEIVLNKN